MSEDKNPTGDEGGGNPTPTPTDHYAELRGKKDDKGVPLHPEEKADFYQKKFSDSSAGAQQLLEDKKRLLEENQTLKTKNDTYSADELRNAIPEFDNLTLEQQKAVINSFGSLKRDLEDVKSQVAEIIDERVFESTFRKVTSEPEFEIIKKYKREFKEYAYQTENVNVPLALLAKSFMVDKKLIGNQAKPDDNADAGRPGMDSGAGGTRQEPKKAGYSAEELEKIRKEDPKKYNRLAREGKLTLRGE